MKPRAVFRAELLELIQYVVNDIADAVNAPELVLDVLRSLTAYGSEPRLCARELPEIIPSLWTVDGRFPDLSGKVDAVMVAAKRIG